MRKGNRLARGTKGLPGNDNPAPSRFLGRRRNYAVNPACLLQEPMIWLKLSVSNTFLAEEVTEKGLMQSVQMHWIAIGRAGSRSPFTSIIV
jgi:hypothetical protein